MTHSVRLVVPFAGAALIGMLALPIHEPSPRIAAPSAQVVDSFSSSQWLAILPDGPAKRAFILDCTGCHQFDARIARTAGRPRSEAEWAAAVTRMLGFAGATSGFPIMGPDRDAAATAAWLADHAGKAPVHRPPPASPTRVVRATITEYDMPVPQDLPHDLAVDRDGRVLVTGMFTHEVIRLDPATRRMERLPIPVPNANPRAIEVDASGAWWLVLGGPRQIARYQPWSRAWRTFDIGFYAHSLALGPSGQVWANGHFTRSPELVRRVRPDQGTIDSIVIPPHPELAERPGGPIPSEIRVGPDGRLWGSELAGNRLFSVHPAGGAVRTWMMPEPSSGPRRFDIDGDGVLWIPAYAGNQLVRLDPRTGRFTPFPLPIPDALPYVVRVDRQNGRVWIGTGAADAILAFDPAASAFTIYPLPSRGALVRHLAIDPRTRDLWIAYGGAPATIPARIARLSATSAP